MEKIFGLRSGIVKECLAMSWISEFNAITGTIFTGLLVTVPPVQVEEEYNRNHDSQLDTV